MIRISVPISIYKCTVSIFKRLSLQWQCNQIAIHYPRWQNLLLLHLFHDLSNDFLHVQFCPFFIFTLIAEYLFSTLFRTKFNIPSIITLWKIAAILTAPGINILSSPKHRKEAYRHLLCNKRRMYNTRSLVEIILFCIFYRLFKRIDLIIWNIFFFQFVF